MVNNKKIGASRISLDQKFTVPCAERLGNHLALLWMYIGCPWHARPQRLPLVLSQAALRRRAATDCVNLRMRDVNFEANQILIRGGKGFKDRMTMLPEMLTDELVGQLKRVKVRHHDDPKIGHANISLPYALRRK